MIHFFMTQKVLQIPCTRPGIQDPERRRPAVSRSKWAVLLFLMGWVLAEGAQAQPQERPADLTQLSLEELMQIEIPLVISASRYEQKVSDAPSSVTLVTADQIKKYGYRTLAGILRSIRGFYTSYDRNYHYGGIWGFSRPGDYTSRVLLLIDGHRVNDNLYGSASIGTEFLLDVDLIDRVEIIRAPSYSLYGNNAFFGVIHVFTRQGRDLRGIEGSGELGTFHATKGRVTYGNQLKNGIEMVLSASALKSRGPGHLFFPEFNDPSNHFGVAEGRDGDRFQGLFTKFSYKELTLEGAYSRRDKDVPTAPYGTTFNDPRTCTNDSYGYLDLQHEHRFRKGLDLKTHLYYEHVHYYGDFPYEESPQGLNRDKSRGDGFGGEILLTRSIGDRHRIVLGGELQRHFRQDQKNYDTLPFFLYFDDHRKSTIWALFVQGEFRLLEQFLVNAGVRYDHYNTFGGTTNPRIALIYHPAEKTSLKLLYGTGFRAPNVLELYYQSTTNLSNPGLKPEKIHTGTLIWEQSIGSHLRGHASLFYYRIHDLISQQTDPGGDLMIYRNAGKVEGKGFELEMEGFWKGGWEGRFSYTYQDVKDKETEEGLSNSPRHLVKFNLIVPILRDRLFAGVEEQFMSKRKTLSGRETDTAFVTNLTLFSQNLFKGLEVSGSLYNVFNKRYSDPGGDEHVQDLLRQDGRTYRFKMTYRF